MHWTRRASSWRVEVANAKTVLDLMQLLVELSANVMKSSFLPTWLGGEKKKWKTSIREESEAMELVRVCLVRVFHCCFWGWRRVLL